MRRLFPAAMLIFSNSIAPRVSPGKHFFCIIFPPYLWVLFLHFWSPHTNRLLSFSLLGLQGVFFLPQTTWFHCQANLPLNFTLANYNPICSRGQRTPECDRFVPGRSIPSTLFFPPSLSSGYNDIGLPGVSALARHPPPSRHALRVYSVVPGGIKHV